MSPKDNCTQLYIENAAWVMQSLTLFSIHKKHHGIDVFLELQPEALAVFVRVYDSKGISREWYVFFSENTNLVQKVENVKREIDSLVKIGAGVI
jgi:hypothetical protein